MISRNKKAYKHFSDRAILFSVLDEMKGRFGFSYSELADRICREIKKYYQNIPKVFHDSTKEVRPKLVLGLSGGVDSSVVAYLAAKAVGVEDVLPTTMPAWDNDECVRLSSLVRKELKISDASVQCVVPILEIVKQEIRTINSLEWTGIEIDTSRESQTDMDRMRIGNFASRARIAILYDIARKVNGKILGTGNRTEFVQGYAAKYGTPISFDFGVLDELYKVDIYALAETLKVPEEIITRVPTTGYFPGQTHEEELGASWEEQDALAFLLFERRMTIEEVAETYQVKRGFVETMLRRYERSKEKRMLRQPRIRLGFLDDEVIC
ncbi:MAG: NAD(+) synthase [Deltaproteobacteria bacterium]|nr:NAD(+) synthase [Deltaproteobacteria bacterium]